MSVCCAPNTGMVLPNLKIEILAAVQTAGIFLVAVNAAVAFTIGAGVMD